jgi:hypothetical protein
MEIDLINTLALYRAAIGYLGEREQFGWWQSSFFIQGSDAFLSPVFGRTQILAQCNGVTRAAALVHDERIGVGNVFHLSRLPEELEQGIQQVLHDAKLEEAVQNITASKDSALVYLQKDSIAISSPEVGPTRVGKIKALRDLETWRSVADLYLYAFEKEKMIFPYFSDIS